MTELRTDLVGHLVDARVAASRGDLCPAPDVADHRRLSRTAYGVLAVALVHGLRSARRSTGPATVTVVN